MDCASIPTAQLTRGLAIGAHALRATAATNALDHQADIAKVQNGFGHANIATTRRPEDSPTFTVNYRGSLPPASMG